MLGLKETEVAFYDAVAQHETARARARAIVRRLLLRHGYPPYGAEAATLLVLREGPPRARRGGPAGLRIDR